METNGKGTVSLNLSKSFSGKVGLFSSPHLINVRERILIDGAFVNDEQWRFAYQSIKNQIDDLALSYFEWHLLLAVVIFAEADVDWAVFEIGLGGRWDAANALDPVCSVLTNVSLDHTAILGDTVELIALEKIEIARETKPFILPASVWQIPTAQKRLKEIGCNIILFEDQGDISDNVACYHEVCSVLEIKNTEKWYSPCARKMKLTDSILLDVSHNPAGWKSTVEWVKKQQFDVEHIVFNLSEGRDPHQFLATIEDLPGKRWVFDVAFDRAYQGDWPASLEHLSPAALSILLERRILVLGSLYFVGEFLTWWYQSQQSER